MTSSILRVAIIGCGNIAGGYDTHSSKDQILTHAKAFQGNLLTKLIAASDINESRLENFSETWKVANTYLDPEELLSKERVDIVSICSPNEFHFDLLKRVVKFKPKAILCEKPLALSSAEGAEMIRLCNEQKIKLAVNYMRRWDPTLKKMGDRIRANEFGRCQSARVYYTKGVFHNASHAINLLQAWLGHTGRATVWRSEAWGVSDFSASFALPFDGCADVVFQGSSADRFNFFEIELIMEKARLLFPGGGSSVSIFRTEPSKLMPNEKALLPSPEIVPGTLGRAIQYVVDDLVTSIISGTGLAMPAEDANETLKVCEEIKMIGVRNV